MSNLFSILRSLVIYGLCLPLAIFLGYSLAMPLDWTNLTVVMGVLLLILLPVLLRWHHPLLILSWNMSAVLFFLPGWPNLWIVMSGLSLMLSILQYVLNRKTEIIYVPTVVRPLIFLVIVLVATAVLTGGTGLRSFGSQAYGGKRYALLLAAIAGYFALSCRRTPPSRAVLYVSLFFLGGVTSVIGSLAPLSDPSLYFIFAIFPPEGWQSWSDPAEHFIRLGGVAVGCMAVVWFILARHGLRGLLGFSEKWGFLPLRFRGGPGVNHPWRILIFVLLVGGGLMGGYRSIAVILGLTLLSLFYFEGLYRSHLLPVMVGAGVLAAVVCVPMVEKLPVQIQRSLSFLPLPIDPVARYDAESTSEWRVRMWRLLLPDVPKYLLLGKGYAINPSELEMARSAAFARTTDTFAEAMVAGDYHSGPLSLVIPLGVFGVIAFLWFLAVSVRVLYNNHRHGDPELRSINTFLLSYFIARVIYFFVVYGSFYGDLFILTGLIGLSISLNGGARVSAPAAVPESAFEQLRLARAAR